MRELRRRWLVPLIAGWALLLVVLALGIGYDGDATVAEQHDIAAARRSVDTATVELVNAAGRDAAVRVSRYEFAAACRISLVRDGVEYRRRVELFTRPGAEDELVAQVARRLPRGYGADTYRDDGSARFTGDADGFVELRGSTLRPGVVRVDLRTGCRPEVAVASLHTPATRAERLRLKDVLDITGATDKGARWRTDAVDCGQSAVRTVTVTGPAAPDRPLGDAAELVPPDARVLLRDGKLLAYRQGAVSVVAEVRGDTLGVTSTAADC